MMSSRYTGVLLVLLSFVGLTCSTPLQDKEKVSVEIVLPYDGGELTYSFVRTFVGELTLDTLFQSDVSSLGYRAFKTGFVGYDWREQKVVLWDSAFNESKMGSKGIGPDEIDDGLYFELYEDTSYRVFDGVQQKIKLFGTDSRAKQTLALDQHYNHFVDVLAASPKKQHLLTGHFVPSENAYFLDLLDFNEEKRVQSVRVDTVFGTNLTATQLEHVDFLMEGSSFATDSLSVFHFYRLGKFVTFNGSTFSSYPTIDQTPLPNVVKHPFPNGGYYILVDPSLELFPSASVAGDTLFILSIITETDEYALDLYNIHSGSYLGSIQVPNLSDGQKPGHIAVSPDRLRLLVGYEDLMLAKYDLKVVKGSEL